MIFYRALIIVSCIGAVIIHSLSFKKVARSNINIFKIKNIMLMILMGILIYVNNFYYSDILSSWISYFILMILDTIIFKEKFVKTLFFSVFCYILVVIFELLFSILLILLSYNNDVMTIKNILLKILYTLLTMFSSYFVCKTQHIIVYVNKIFNTFLNTKAIIILSIFVTLTPITLSLNNIIDFSSKNYFLNFIFLLTFIFLFIYTCYNSFNFVKESKNSQRLITKLSDYEKTLEEDSIQRHEILNELLILKSYKDKNSIKYNKQLDNLIKNYSKKRTGIKNISSLQYGIKRIIYIKLSEAKELGIDTDINISKQLNEMVENGIYNSYYNLCKIISILLDNAIEAAKDSKKRIMSFYIYKEKNDVVFDISNSFNNTVDLNTINLKNVSTKGKKRGLGLFIVSNILKKNKNIILNQSIKDDIFYSTVKINIKYLT